MDQKIETGVGPITDRLINATIDTINSPSFKKNVSEKIIDPASEAISRKIKPYIYLGFLMYLIVVILLIIILIMLTRKKRT